MGAPEKEPEDGKVEARKKWALSGAKVYNSILKLPLRAEGDACARRANKGGKTEESQQPTVSFLPALCDTPLLPLPRYRHTRFFFFFFTSLSLSRLPSSPLMASFPYKVLNHSSPLVSYS